MWLFGGNKGEGWGLGDLCNEDRQGQMIKFPF